MLLPDYDNMNKRAKNYWAYVEQKIDEYNTNGKPTIALFCDSYYPAFDGVINVQTNYAHRLLGTYNVVMVAPRTKQHYVTADYLTLLCKSVFLPMVNYPYALPRWDRVFRRHLRQLRIDLVHIHGPFTMGHLGVRYARRHHLPVVGTFHTQFKKDFLRYVKLELFTRPLVRYITNCFNRCDEVWTMNDANVAILRTYGYHGPTRIVPNGTDLVPTAAHDQLVTTLNQQYGLTDQPHVMMFCGRMVTNKNIFLIADALQILTARHFSYHLFFVGDGLDLNKLKKYVTARGLAPYITFTGKVTDRTLLGAYYLRSDLLLFPSVYDTDGIVKYEAAAFGTPSLLIADSPSAVGTIDQQTAYLTVPTAEALADKIVDIFAHPDVLQKVSTAAHQHLYRHWDNIVHDVAQIYALLLTKKL